MTGIGITRCGYCGTALVAQNLMQRVKADGSLVDGHRRLHCVSYSKNGGCNAGSCSSVPIEHAVLAYCSDQMNLQRLLEPSSADEELRTRLAEAQQGVAEVERQLQRVTDALVADDSGAAPLSFVRKARELEEELERRRSAVRVLERELVAMASSVPVAEASKWAELAEQAKSVSNVEAREQARQLVMDTFERIVVYMRGVVPEGRRSKYIDVLLVSRAGQSRWLRVGRRTGAWSAGGDWNGSAP